MPIIVDRRAKVEVIASGLKTGWSSWVTVRAHSYVSDKTIASLARAQVLADLGAKGVAVSSIKVTEIEPLD